MSSFCSSALPASDLSTLNPVVSPAPDPISELPPPPRVSIIIPTFNEDICLDRTLRTLAHLQPPAWEILVVDGGSQDQTLMVAANHGIKGIAAAERGRSCQMNAGAAQATGELLCFLHADTLVPDDLIALIRSTLADPRTACGGFISLMAGAKITRWGTSLHNYLKTYYAPLLFHPYLFFFKGLRVLFGDQVMFCRRTDFGDCGGFDSTLALMEDADLCRRLVQQGKGRIRLVNRVVQSSDRRVAHWGPWKANFIYCCIGFLWGLGVSSTRLKSFYQEIR